MSRLKITVFVEMKIVIFLLIILLAKCKKAKKKPPEHEEDTEDLDGDVFCKNQSRLIRMEKADEIYIVDTEINNTIVLQCKYCEERDNGFPKTWSWQKHIFTGNITEVEPEVKTNVSLSSIFVSKSHSLVVRNLQERNLGLYFCKAPYVDSLDESFNYLVDLSLKGEPEVHGTMEDFKNYTRFFLGSINDILSGKIFVVRNILFKMKVFTEWTNWSDCDSCFRKEGIKYKLGKCRVKPICQDLKCTEQRKRFKSFVFNDKQNVETPNSIESEVIDPAAVEENIMEFGLALSCRSFLMTKLLPDLYNVTSTVPDFILSEKCFAPCKTSPPKKGPRYRKSIILARGAHLTLVCPDSTIDSDVRWEHNKRRLYPNEGEDYIQKSTEPRLYVDSFNTLYLFDVTDKESGNFTCFVDGFRMQEVKIIVLTRSIFFTKEFTRHLKYLGFVFLLCFVGYLGGVVFMCVKSHAEKKGRLRGKYDDTEKLLKKKKKKKKRKQVEFDSDSSY